VEEKIELTIRKINDWKRALLIFISISVLLFISSLITYFVFPNVKISDNLLSEYLAVGGGMILLAGVFTVLNALRKHPLRLIMDEEKFEYVYFFKKTKKIKEMKWSDIKIIKPNNRLVDINSNEIEIYYLTTDQLQIFMKFLNKIKIRYPNIKKILIGLEKEPKISLTIPGKGKRYIIVDRERIQYIMNGKHLFSITWSEIYYLKWKAVSHYGLGIDYYLEFHLSHAEKHSFSDEYFQRANYKKLMDAINQYAFYHKIEWKN
jgi:hypothetical protein